ncbi:GPO family capsid scaffolding protein [Orbus wheelerorum]|uniref:GPO family capsid scaffolding protein n=1 Tax=Orbus wheelerorum TaxID=3074111 RepID=UPI00370D1FE2
MAEEIKKSDWFCIAQEGKTIDGRDIKREWIESAANTYSVELYAAMIWCEHEDPEWRQWCTNFGMVEEVKTEEKNGKLRLMARLRANQFLQELNKAEQKVFTSIELMSDFPEEGQHYLSGLALTDQPASTGLTRLAFSKEGKPQRLISMPILFSVEQKQAKKSFFNRFKFTQTTETEEKPTMTQEEIDALVAELEAAKAKIAELQTTIEDLNTKLSANDTTGAKAEAEKAADQAEAASDAVENAADKAEFAKLKKQNIELNAKLDDLSKKFSQAVSTPVTTKPGISANGDGFEFH